MSFFLKEQINFIHWFQDLLRSPNMDCFFRAWNFVDTADFLFLLIPFIWIGYQRKLGLQIFYGALISSMLNAVLKELFHIPRPFITAPSLGVILVNGLSFPSGAAQTAIWLPGLFVLHFQHRVMLAIGILFGALLSISRVYLGVHYPLDLLGGWIVGALILYALSPSGFYPKLLKWWNSTGKIQRLLFTTLATIFLLLHPSGKGYMFASVFLGVQLGILLCPRDSQALLPTSKSSILLRGLFGLTGIALLLLLLTTSSKLLGANFKPLLNSLFYFLIGLWLSAGAASLLQYRLRFARSRAVR